MRPRKLNTQQNDGTAKGEITVAYYDKKTVTENNPVFLPQKCVFFSRHTYKHKKMKHIIAFSLLLMSFVLTACEKEDDNRLCYYIRYEAQRELPAEGGIQISYTTAEGKSKTVRMPSTDRFSTVIGPVGKGFTAQLYASGYGGSDLKGVYTRIYVCRGSEPFVLTASHGGKDFLNSRCQYQVGN